MKFNNVLLLLAISIAFTSCAPKIVKIGTVNSISHRNIDYGSEYELISSYSGGSKKALKKAKAESIEEAIEQTVRKVPGGEMLMNVKIYNVSNKYFAVEGDVWGKKGVKRSFRGFSVGTAVVCKDKKLLKKLDFKSDIIYGVVSGLIDDKEVYVKIDGEERTIKLPYDKITKAE